MKRFGDYSLAIRSAAIDTLAERGVYVWGLNFDANSDQVLEACRYEEEQTMLPDIPDKSMYAWTPAMVEAHQNRVDRMPGMRLSDSEYPFWGHVTVDTLQ